MTKEEDEEIGTKPHFGTVNFERRRQLRISTDLPAEYWHVENPDNHPGRLLNASEGGLLLYLPEKIEAGQNLKVRLFIGPILELEPIDAFVQVVWNELHWGQNGHYRTGVEFVNISPVDMDKLRSFLNTLTTVKGPSEPHLPSRLLNDLGLSNLKSFPPAPPKPPDEA